MYDVPTKRPGNSLGARLSRMPRIVRWGVYAISAVVALKVLMAVLVVVSVAISLLVGVAFLAVLVGIAYALLKRR